MRISERIDAAMVRAIARGQGRVAPAKLASALEYAVTPGGARIRPTILTSVAMACGDDVPALTDAAAVALEVIHCASLVHDDLPCFDDADLRRGKPALHRAYSEPLAVLAGDSLIIMGFQELARAARDLVSKLSDAIPKELRPIVLDASSKTIQTRNKVAESFDSALLRHAIRQRYRLELAYEDRNGKATQRIIWPLLIAFLDRARYLIGWCETRQDFRNFKTDRVRDLKVLSDKFPGRRPALIKEWEAQMAERARQRAQRPDE